SGTPISAIGAHELYGPSEAFILTRGSNGRTPWVNNFDTNVGVNYRVSKANVVSLSLDVFNVFNFQGVTAVDQIYTNVAVKPIEGGKANGELTPDQVLRASNGQPLTEADRNLNYKNPTQYQAPRQIRLGLKYTF
ncbi:MAG TPA: TonB-dependent receptor, partial [Archangium sp.]